MCSVSHFTVTLMILRGNPVILSWMRILALTLLRSLALTAETQCTHARLLACYVMTHAETYKFDDDKEVVVCFYWIILLSRVPSKHMIKVLYVIQSVQYFLDLFFYYYFFYWGLPVFDVNI